MSGVLPLLFEPELRAWRGQLPLATAFWNFGVLRSAVLALLYILAAENGRLALQQGLLVAFAAYTVWILVAVWRCADNAEPFWGLVARWATVAWALNTVLLLTFLQLDLVRLYLGR